MMKLKFIPVLSLVLIFSFCFNSTRSQALHHTGESKAITHEYASVNNIKLHYAKAGNGKKLIIFLHGFPEFWYEYKNQLLEFSKNNEYTIIAPDMRGYNLSSKPDSLKEYQVKYMVEDLRLLSEKLGFRTFSLVAHDWGGAIAWWFAIVHPRYLDKLIIINAPHPAIFRRELAQNTEQQKASAYMTFLYSPQAEQVLSANNYEKLGEILFGHDLKSMNFTEADRQEYLKAWSQPGALTGALNYYRAAYFLGSGMDTSSYRVNVPTLVIWGEKDKYLMTSNLIGLEKYVPVLTISKFPEGSHWIIHEQPQMINKRIKEFIR
jgi:epoxide hydrolase 4